MPPCAQTECERLTGTMEKRSTGIPDSAARMVAMSPARPPPTIMIFGCLIWVCNRKQRGDRKSTRLNSSHTVISYAVFCLKKKKKNGWHVGGRQRSGGRRSHRRKVRI